jgi:hypothetical protein
MGRKTASKAVQVQARGQPAQLAERSKSLLAARSRAAKLRGRIPRQAEQKLGGIANLKVLDDFPNSVAVLDRELETLETYLGPSLGQLFGDMD